MQLENFPATGFVRLPQVLAVFPVGKSSWWTGIKAGHYPRGHKLGGGRITAWGAEDLRTLIEHTENEVRS